MAELQKPFRGLSGFIGLFRGGNVGMDFNRQIQPVLEMEDWLGPNDFIIQTFSLAAPGNRASAAIPEDEFWRLKYGAVHVDAAAAGAGTVILNKEVTAAGTTFDIPMSPMVNAENSAGASFFNNGTNIVGGFGQDVRPMNGQPGERVGVQLQYMAAAGPVTGYFFYQFQRIKV